MNEANEVLRRYRWNGSLPIDVFAIASDYALVVGQELKAEGISGKCYASHTENHGKPLIVYDREAAPNLQRFTVAHELGHITLNHGHAFSDPVKNFNRRNLDRKESEANQFAAELLMPMVAIEYYLGEKREYSFERLSQLFGVSQMAVKIRLQDLGFAVFL